MTACPLTACVFHGARAKLFIDDQAGTVQEMTGETNSITFTRSKNNPEYTVMGSFNPRRISGIRDVTIDITSVFDAAGSPENVVPLLDQMFAGSLISRVQLCPGGCGTCLPIYTASMLLNNYAVNIPVDGIVTLTYSLALAAGSVTAACQ